MLRAVYCAYAQALQYATPRAQPCRWWGAGLVRRRGPRRPQAPIGWWPPPRKIEAWDWRRCDKACLYLQRDACLSAQAAFLGTWAGICDRAGRSSDGAVRSSRYPDGAVAAGWPRCGPAGGNRGFLPRHSRDTIAPMTRVWGSTVLLGLGLLAVLPPLAYWGASWEIGCVSQRLLGLPCPGCGLGRALMALGRGDVALALRAYPALLGLVPAYGVALVLTGTAAWGGTNRVRRGQIFALTGMISAVAIVCSWLCRLALP